MYRTTLGILSVPSNVRRCNVTVCFKASHSHWHTDLTRKSLGPKGPDAAGGQAGPTSCQTGVSPPSERRVLYMPRRSWGIYRAGSERGGETQVWREGGPSLFVLRGSTLCLRMRGTISPIDFSLLWEVKVDNSQGKLGLFLVFELPGQRTRACR